MSEKLIVNKRLGIGLKEALEVYDDEENTVDRIILHTITGRWSGARSELHKISLEDLSRALINGFEIEETKEEKILKIFEYYKERCGRMNDLELENRGKVNGIIECLNTLEIKIKGINE